MNSRIHRRDFQKRLTLLLGGALLGTFGGCSLRRGEPPGIRRPEPRDPEHDSGGRGSDGSRRRSRGQELALRPHLSVPGRSAHGRRLRQHPDPQRRHGAGPQRRRLRGGQRRGPFRRHQPPSFSACRTRDPKPRGGQSQLQSAPPDRHHGQVPHAGRIHPPGGKEPGRFAPPPRRNRVRDRHRFGSAPGRPQERPWGRHVRGCRALPDHGGLPVQLRRRPIPGDR